MDNLRPKRPHIPLRIKCEVARRQLYAAHGPLLQLPRDERLGDWLGSALRMLGLDPGTAELHHNPPLGLRRVIICEPCLGQGDMWIREWSATPPGERLALEPCKQCGGTGRKWDPDANDPEKMEWLAKDAHAKRTNGKPHTSYGSDKHAIAKTKRYQKEMMKALEPFVGKPNTPQMRVSVTHTTASRSRWPKGRKLQSRPFSRKGDR